MSLLMLSYCQEVFKAKICQYSHPILLFLALPATGMQPEGILSLRFAFKVA